MYRPLHIACNTPTRGGHGRTCQLPQGHTGTHSAHVFRCEACDLVHRGAPYRLYPDAPDCPPGCGIAYCFLCANELRKD